MLASQQGLGLMHHGLNSRLHLRPSLEVKGCLNMTRIRMRHPSTSSAPAAVGRAQAATHL